MHTNIVVFVRRIAKILVHEPGLPIEASRDPNRLEQGSELLTGHVDYLKPCHQKNSETLLKPITDCTGT